MSFNAHEERVMSLLNRKVYSVPRNQRRYVWGKENWQELFDDVMAVVEGKLPSHFIGSIVLKTDPQINGLPHYSIIDGQQRTITIAIFLSSIMFWMQKNRMASDFNGTKPYLIAKDDKDNDVVMVTAENNGSLDNIITAITGLTTEQAKKVSVGNIIESNLLNRNDINVGNAFRFFMNSIGDLIESKQNKEEYLVNLRNAVRDITFINITATTEEDSYTVFEILNARGLDLEDHELLKNYIMRYIQPENTRDKAKEEWRRIEEALGATNLKRFVRHYAIHRYGNYITKSETSDYKIIREHNKWNSTVDLLSDLARKSQYYLKLVSPAKSGNEQNCSNTEYRIFSFFKKKRQEQLRPLLLSLITQNMSGNLENKLYESTLEFIYNFYICYNIIGEENSNRLTNIVMKYSAKLNRDCSEATIIQFIEELRKKLPSENMFINAFKNVGWSHHASIYEGDKNKIRVQTVLEVLERFHNFGNCADDFTIEHILPDAENSTNGQIGNLIPLENVINKNSDTKPINEKLDQYRKSSYATARRMYDNYHDKEFDPEKRTEFMAKEFYNEILHL